MQLGKILPLDNSAKMQQLVRLVICVLNQRQALAHPGSALRAQVGPSGLLQQMSRALLRLAGPGGGRAACAQHSHGSVSGLGCHDLGWYMNPGSVLEQ